MSIETRVKGTLELLSYVAVIAAAGVVVWRLGFPSSAGPTIRGPVENVVGLSIDAGSLSNVTGDGPVAIVEFSDFDCPFCAKYAQDVLPVVQRDLIESGEIRYVPFHFPIEALHPNAVTKAQAAECAAKQGRFWQMHRRLFEPLSTGDVRPLAERAGLDPEQLAACVTSGRELKKIRADQALGRQLGVASTPTFFVGRVSDDGSIDLRSRISGLPAIDVLKKEVQKIRTLASSNSSPLRRRGL